MAGANLIRRIGGFCAKHRRIIQHSACARVPAGIMGYPLLSAAFGAWLTYVPVAIGLFARRRVPAAWPVTAAADHYNAMMVQRHINHPFLAQGLDSVCNFVCNFLFFDE